MLGSSPSSSRPLRLLRVTTSKGLPYHGGICLPTARRAIWRQRQEGLSWPMGISHPLSDEFHGGGGMLLVSPPPAASCCSAVDFLEHEVSRMDTLAGIAIKYGVQVNNSTLRDFVWLLQEGCAWSVCASYWSKAPSSVLNWSCGYFPSTDQASLVTVLKLLGFFCL